MDNFKIIYKILRYLEKAMDYEEPDFSAISPESPGISRERWSALLIMLCKDDHAGSWQSGDRRAGSPDDHAQGGGIPL